MASGRPYRYEVRMSFGPAIEALLASLPKKPILVIKRPLAIMELVFEEPLADEERRELEAKLGELLGNGYKVELEEKKEMPGASPIPR